MIMATSKFNNKVLYTPEGKFDSRKEYRRWCSLRLLEKAGQIAGLRRQVRYEIIPAIWEEVPVQLKTKVRIDRRCVQRASHYTADFVYTDTATGRTIVEDVKGRDATKTEAYELRKKLMRFVHGIEIIEK